MLGETQKCALFCGFGTCLVLDCSVLSDRMTEVFGLVVDVVWLTFMFELSYGRGLLVSWYCDVFVFFH